MVPGTGSASWATACFPRASGDGPWFQARCSRSVRFPPRERGWSVSIHLFQHLDAVSPARAGMVRRGKNESASFRCFPRASGDGPVQMPKTNASIQFPPRERGWSQHRRPGAANGCVSPARAGMVPLWANSGLLWGGFPRASGDGPPRVVIDSGHVQFPPRERGWSHGVSLERGHAGVSPARAGMVPSGWPRSCTLRCFPRASGDGPRARCDRRRPGQFPPRERGWSPLPEQSPTPTTVSPARAGMVPGQGPSSWDVLRFPRASGDGP